MEPTPDKEQRPTDPRATDPSATDPRATDPRDGLASVVALRNLADRLEAAEVGRAISAGWTWSRIAEALGVTRQAVHKRYAKRVSEAGAQTGQKGNEKGEGSRDV